MLKIIFALPLESSNIGYVLQYLDIGVKERSNTNKTLSKLYINDIYFSNGASKSSTRSFVSSVPFLEPTAQTNFVGLALIRHTTPPLPPLFNATKSRMNSPVIR